MTIKHYPWLENTLKKYEQRNFASSIIIEGEGGLAKSELASHFAKRLLCSQIDAPCDNCNSCNYYEASSHPDFCHLILVPALCIQFLKLKKIQLYPRR